MKTLASGWMRRYAVAVRAVAAVAIAAMTSVTLLATRNACCGPDASAQNCSDQGCLQDSYCVDRVIEQIAACCGVGDGQAFCLRNQVNQPQVGWCVMCQSGRQCGNCPPLEGGGCNPSANDLMNCQADGYQWDYGLCACNYSPIVIQLNARDRYVFTNTANGVRFDVNGDGRREQSAWTAPGERQAFLVLDRNGNGVVDSAAEFFGNFTPLDSGARAANGFEALAELEDQSGEANGIIDARDPIYHQLRLWIDVNHDGVSEPGELSGLAQMGVVAVSTSYRKVNRYDDNGNLLAFQGAVRLRTASGDRRKAIYDVYFQVIPSGSLSGN